MFSYKLNRHEFFVLDDNGGNSIDSRHFGCINKRNIVGKMIYLFFPLPSIGKIN
ncbi:S26 family signal peptidase [Vagococcus sp. CY52-2]|uniref:S26 family signal peptidase n=1 Tax=Vagococcus sp. CY52-2 TaxID=2925838 RepID=UPI0035303DF8